MTCLTIYCIVCLIYSTCSCKKILSFDVCWGDSVLRFNKLLLNDYFIVIRLSTDLFRCVTLAKVD